MFETTCFFFGTFNPIHLGHLWMAEAARWQGNFEQIIFVPAFDPPHRVNEPTRYSFSNRLWWIRAAIEENPSFSVNDIEMHLPVPSYTFNTLEALLGPVENWPKPVPLIIGRDALNHLPTWHKGDVLARVCRFYQAPRSGALPIHQLDFDGTDIELDTQLLDVPEINVSAAVIRNRLQQGQSVRYLVPEPIYANILAQAAMESA